MAKKTEDYQTLSAELDGVLTALQDPEVQVDQAVALYEKGLELIAKLESYVAGAENTIQKLQLQAKATKGTS
ncbi:MAG TPA: exodeoxyribonuclease VII small subunit [Candidatus Saccharimonadales bacterium]|nr:exodeoxyribonuclease VII small subunit [Candidatus Saccharimonadales bacterium]